MLSPKVDLTENGDFSRGGTLSPSADFILLPTINGSRITEDDYKDIISHDKIFGRRRHYSEFDRVFDVSLKRYLKEEIHCLHCNKELKEPWNINHYCCNECARALNWSKDYKRPILNLKFPWEIIPNHPEPIDNRDVLNMR